MPRFELNDEDVVVIVGSGAGGGTMAHELTRRGMKVVLFEAGKRLSLTSFSSQNPSEAFAQLTWLEPRSQSGTWDPVKTSPTLPAWHCRTVGGPRCIGPRQPRACNPTRYAREACMAIYPGPRSPTGPSSMPS